MSDKIYLPSTFNHDECQTIYDDCKRVLQNNKGIIINAGSIERIGTAGIQILLSVGQYCKEKNMTCVLESPSETMLDALNQVGCSQVAKSLGIIS